MQDPSRMDHQSEQLDCVFTFRFWRLVNDTGENSLVAGARKRLVHSSCLLLTPVFVCSDGLTPFLSLGERYLPEFHASGLKAESGQVGFPVPLVHIETYLGSYSACYNGGSPGGD